MVLILPQTSVENYRLNAVLKNSLFEPFPEKNLQLFSHKRFSQKLSIKDFW